MGERAPELELTLKRTVVLIGMMGAGKTAVGRALAQRLSVPLLDSDAVIVERAQLTIAEIFERYGEAFFREKESQVIDSLLAPPASVLSTGGGAWMTSMNRDMLTERATVLWLEADLDLLWTRVRHKTSRPLLRTDNPRQTLSEIMAERTPIYRLAPHSLRVSGAWSITDTTDRVLSRLIEVGAVGRGRG